jgi:cytochrome c biogenesis protein CcmG, thiol:disulfide interchange protein DsbE
LNKTYDEDGRLRRKSWIFLLSGLLVGISLAAMVLAGNLRPGSNKNDQALLPDVGKPVKDFQLVGLDGKTYQLSDLRGRPVVINFWATWCPPCEEEMPLLEKYAAQHTGELVLLGIDYAEEQGVVEKFVTAHKISFPILLDTSGTVADLYYTRNFPTTFFVDSDGILRAQHLGVLTGELMDQYLALLEVKP